jgi:hypothetical protein
VCVWELDFQQKNCFCFSPSRPSFHLFSVSSISPQSSKLEFRLTNRFDRVPPSFQMLNCITNLESLGSGRENTHLNCFVVTIRLNGSHLLSSNHFFTLPIMTQSRLSRKLLIDIWRNIGSINFVVGHICGICEAEQKNLHSHFYNLCQSIFKGFKSFSERLQVILHWLFISIQF